MPRMTLNESRGSMRYKMLGILRREFEKWAEEGWEEWRINPPLLNGYPIEIKCVGWNHSEIIACGDGIRIDVDMDMSLHWRRTGIYREQEEKEFSRAVADRLMGWSVIDRKIFEFESFVSSLNRDDITVQDVLTSIKKQESFLALDWERGLFRDIVYNSLWTEIDSLAKRRMNGELEGLFVGDGSYGMG